MLLETPISWLIPHRFLAGPASCLSLLCRPSGSLTEPWPWRVHGYAYFTVYKYIRYWKQLRKQSLPLIVMIIMYLYLCTIGRTINGRLCSFDCSEQSINKTYLCKVQICKFLFMLSLRKHKSIFTKKLTIIDVTIMPQTADPLTLLIFSKELIQRWAIVEFYPEASIPNDVIRWREIPEPPFTQHSWESWCAGAPWLNLTSFEEMMSKNWCNWVKTAAAICTIILLFFSNVCEACCSHVNACVAALSRWVPSPSTHVHHFLPQSWAWSP